MTDPRYSQDEDHVLYLQKELERQDEANDILTERIAELENAIRKHRDTVATLLAVFEGDDRAETCEEDNQLWAVLGGDDE